MATIRYKQKGRIGLFDKEETSVKLSKLGNPLEKIRQTIDFETLKTVETWQSIGKNSEND